MGVCKLFWIAGRYVLIICSYWPSILMVKWLLYPLIPICIVKQVRVLGLPSASCVCVCLCPPPPPRCGMLKVSSFLNRSRLKYQNSTTLIAHTHWPFTAILGLFGQHTNSFYLVKAKYLYFKAQYPWTPHVACGCVSYYWQLYHKIPFKYLIAQIFYIWIDFHM